MNSSLKLTSANFLSLVYHSCMGILKAVGVHLESLYLSLVKYINRNFIFVLRKKKNG